MPDPSDDEARTTWWSADAVVVKLDRRFDRFGNEMRAGFAEICSKLDQLPAGQQHIVDLLTVLIDRRRSTGNRT